MEKKRDNEKKVTEAVFQKLKCLKFVKSQKIRKKQVRIKALIHFKGIKTIIPQTNFYLRFDIASSNKTKNNLKDEIKSLQRP